MISKVNQLETSNVHLCVGDGHNVQHGSATRIFDKRGMPEACKKLRKVTVGAAKDAAGEYTAYCADDTESDGFDIEQYTVRLDTRPRGGDLWKHVGKARMTTVLRHGQEPVTLRCGRGRLFRATSRQTAGLLRGTGGHYTFTYWYVFDVTRVTRGRPRGVTPMTLYQIGEYIPAEEVVGEAVAEAVVEAVVARDIASGGDSSTNWVVHSNGHPNSIETYGVGVHS
eukprot:COSAG05_NODE_354_length_10862_cov_59.954659_10_plen_225_part_00